MAKNDAKGNDEPPGLSKSSAVDETSEPVIADARQSSDVTPASVTQGPVISKDGTIDKANLSRFVTGLAALVPPLPVGVNDTLNNRRNKLLGRLDYIRNLAAPESPALTSQRLLEIRDQFAKAANDARKLTKHFLGLRFPRYPDTDSALAYSCLAANLVELKRIHLTAAAPFVMSDYVRKEMKNLEKKVPTIGYMSTSTISKDSSLGVAHDFGVARVEITGNKNRTLWFDDDRDINFWDGFGLAVEGGGPAKWIVDTALKLGIELGGVYFETETMEDILKLIVNHDANHAHHLGLNSAGPMARPGMTWLKRGYNAVKKNLGGQVYAEHHGSPHYLSDRKLAKGFNFTKLHTLGKAFNRMAGTEEWGNLLYGFQTRLKDKDERKRTELALRNAVSSGMEEQTENRLWKQLTKYGFRKSSSQSKLDQMVDELDITASTSGEEADDKKLSVKNGKKPVRGLPSMEDIEEEPTL